MRLFIAIELSEDIRSDLSEIQSYMKEHGVRGNFTRVENLHLTLAFIGECGDDCGVRFALSLRPWQKRHDLYGARGYTDIRTAKDFAWVMEHLNMGVS